MVKIVTLKHPVGITIRQRSDFEGQPRLGGTDGTAEASIYPLKGGMLAKVFHDPTPKKGTIGLDRGHIAKKLPELRGRLEALMKLPLPDVFPLGPGMSIIATTRGGMLSSEKAIGFTMPRLDGRVLAPALMPSEVVSLDVKRHIGPYLMQIYDIVVACHNANADVVLGDGLNPDNIFIGRNGKVHILEPDTLQIGSKYPCRTCWAEGTDPRKLEIVNPTSANPTIKLRKAHCKQGDWYTVMALALKMFTGAEVHSGLITTGGGFFTSGKTTTAEEMMKSRQTVFAPGIKYPANCRPLSVIPSNMLKVMKAILQDGKEAVPPRRVFEELLK